ncbi:MAG: hypothetical protein GY705_28230 [Bacteroidetes bacterium]|nr:hypothetical protein [Bacteroidota bacterium]
MKFENIGILIQARMNSSRLPGKILKKFCGKPMLIFQVELIQQFNLNMDVVVLTSNNPMDDQVEEICRNKDILFFRGSEANVFERYQLAVEKFGFSHIVRLTGDNPLTNYSILTKCISDHLKKKSDLTSTRKVHTDRTIERFVPKGFSIDIINCRSLLSIKTESLDAFQKEHVIPVFFNDKFQVNYMSGVSNISEEMSVDTAEDFKRVCNTTKSYIESKKLHDILGCEKTLLLGET